MERANYGGDAGQVSIPWDRVKRSSQAKRLAHLTTAQKRARQIRAAVFRIWSMRDRLNRSALGADATDLLRRLDEQECSLRRELSNL